MPSPGITLGSKPVVLFVIGTRPEAIKMALVIRALKDVKGIHPTLCSSGQHAELLDHPPQSLNLEPDICLNLMRQSQEPVELLVQMMDGVTNLSHPGFDALMATSSSSDEGVLITNVGHQPEDNDQMQVLITAHRRENHGPPQESIARGVRVLAREFRKVRFIWCLHPNPNARTSALRVLAGEPNVELIEALPYSDFVELLRRSTLILTDSGGIQEEAVTLQKPTLVLRNLTERPEAIESGWVRILGTESEEIVAVASRLLSDKQTLEEFRGSRNPFGDGRAAQRIADAVEHFLLGATS